MLSDYSKNIGYINTLEEVFAKIYYGLYAINGILDLYDKVCEGIRKKHIINMWRNIIQIIRGKSIMKKIVCCILVCLAIFLKCSVVTMGQTAEYDMDLYFEDVYYGYEYAVDKVWGQFLKDNSKIDYCRAVDNLSGTQKVLDFASKMLGEQLDQEKYIRILSGLITAMTYDFENYINCQKEMDSLKGISDYAWDVMDIVAGAVSLEKISEEGISDSIYKKLENLQSVAGITWDIADFSLNRYEDLETYNLLLNNYSMCIEFLSAVETYATDPNLVAAAAALKKATGYTLQYQLKIIEDAAGEMAKIIGDDIIFEQIVPQLLKSPQVLDINQVDYETLNILNESISQAKDLIALGEDTFNLCIFGGDMLFGTSNTYNRYNEMVALRNIRTALNKSIEQRIKNIYDSEQMEEIKTVCNILQNILYVDFRGYYCLYNLVENDAQLLSLFNFGNYDTYKKWYSTAGDMVKELKDIVDGVFPDISLYLKEDDSKSESNTVPEMIIFDNLTGMTYEYDDGIIRYQLSFSGGKGNITATMGTFSSGGSGTGMVGFQITLKNGVETYSNVCTSVEGVGIIENHNIVSIKPVYGGVYVSWVDDEKNMVVEAKFLSVARKEMDGILPVKVDETLQIICNEKNLSYIGNQTYSLSAYWSEEGSYPTLSKLETEGVMAALEMDFDEDGEQEIFAVTYEPSELIPDGKSIHFAMWKRQQREWKILTETEVVNRDWEGNYHDMSCLNGTTNYYEGSVFVRKSRGSYEFFYEDYSEGIFATGQGWCMKGFRFEDGMFSQIKETESIYYYGSPIDVLWTCSDEELRQYEEGLAQMRENYCSLGFVKPDIYFDQMTVDQNPSLYPILKMRLQSDSSIEEVIKWFSNHQRSLDTFWCQIEDISDDIPSVLDCEAANCQRG